MDRLDRSLDELISFTPRGGSGGRGGKRIHQEEGRRGAGGRSGGSARSFQSSRSERITKTAVPYHTNTAGPYHIATPQSQTQSTKTVVISRKPLARQVPQPVRPVIQNSFSPPEQNFVPPKYHPQEESSQSNTIFDRIGSKPSTAMPDFISGTRVRISNLNPDITAGEVAELYGSLGEIKGAEMKFDRFGQSLGVVDLIFSRRSEGLAAITKFHGLTLDGSPMDVKLADETHTVTPVATTTLTSTNRILGGPVTSTLQPQLQQPFRNLSGNAVVPEVPTSSNKIPSSLSRNQPFLNRVEAAAKPVNVREGLFGVSMNDDAYAYEYQDDVEEEEEEVYYEDEEEEEVVPVGYRNHTNQHQTQRGNGRSQTATPALEQPWNNPGRRGSGGSGFERGGGYDSNPRGSRRGGGGGGGGGVGRARGAGGQPTGRPTKKGGHAASYGEGDLDAELDAYMTARS